MKTNENEILASNCTNLIKDSKYQECFLQFNQIDHQEKNKVRNLISYQLNN